jgi:hypothetical protein
MTVSVQIPYKAHTANGVTTTFSYDFRVRDASTLKVFVNGLQQFSGFSVTGLGVASGGTVVFSTAPANQASILLARVTPLSRATDYTDDLLTDVLNADADRVWEVLQEFAAGLRASLGTVRAPEGEVLSVLPAATSRAGKVVSFDTAGDVALVELTGDETVVWTSFESEQQVATAGQTVFNLGSGTYVPGTNSLRVFVDGISQNPGADYTETSASSVTFTTGRVAGQRVRFDMGRYVSSGLPLSSVGKGIAEDSSGTATDAGSYRFRRRATYSGGTPGFVNSALFVDTFVESSAGSGTSSAAAFEWAGTFVMHNYSTAGENVALYRQGIKYAGAGPTWAGTDEIIDWNTNPTTGVVGVELSFTANGTDTNSTRVAYDVALRKRDSGGAAPVLSWGYRIQTEAGSKVVRGYSFTSGSTADVGFDTSLATINTAAFKMAEGQAIVFRAADDRKVFHDGTGLKFADASNTLLFRLNDTGIPQFGIASTAATTAASFSANRTIRIQQLDGTVLYIPAMLSTW